MIICYQFVHTIDIEHLIYYQIVVSPCEVLIPALTIFHSKSPYIPLVLSHLDQILTLHCN